MERKHSTEDRVLVFFTATEGVAPIFSFFQSDTLMETVFVSTNWRSLLEIGKILGRRRFLVFIFPKKKKSDVQNNQADKQKPSGSIDW